MLQDIGLVDKLLVTLRTKSRLLDDHVVDGVDKWIKQVDRDIINKANFEARAMFYSQLDRFLLQSRD